MIIDYRDDMPTIERKLQRRVRILHAANPKCAICKKPIDKPENASHNLLASGREFIVHTHIPACQFGALEIMLDRYLTKSERQWESA